MRRCGLRCKLRKSVGVARVITKGVLTRRIVVYCREMFAYASAARRRTYDAGDGDGGGGGGSGAFFISLSSHTYPCVLLRADCSHLIGGDFNATIKPRLAGRIKEINRKYDSPAAPSASTAATTASPADRKSVV